MEIISRTCPVCNSNDNSKILQNMVFDKSKLNNYSFSSRKHPDNMNLRMVICPVCDLCYANPIFEKSWVEEKYKNANFNTANESQYAAQTHANFLSKYLDFFPNFDNALDIGTGDGAFLDKLHDMGFSNILGIEPSKAPIKVAKSKTKIRNEFFNSDSFPNEYFNVISCLQTIEHVYDPLNIFTSAYKLLRPGGCLFIVAHNYKAISARLLGGASPIFDIEHLQLFSKKSMAELYKRTGFSSIQVKTLLNRYPLSYWLRLLPITKGIKNKIINTINKFNMSNIKFSIPAGNLAAIGFKPF